MKDILLMLSKLGLTSVLKLNIKIRCKRTIAFGSSFIIFTSPLLTTAQSHQFATPTTLSEVAESNLRFIANEQKTNGDGIYEAYEWPTHIYSSLLPALLGVGSLIGHDEEATAFTTASVMNQLATLYIENPEEHEKPEFRAIPGLLAKGAGSFARYRVGDVYNFYPPRFSQGVLVHQPADMKLLDLWKGLTNIPPDADTSSSVFTALTYTALLNGQTYSLPDEALAEFSLYRDTARQAHFYNRHEHQVETGAFMTWLANENDPKMPHSYFDPPEKGARIPFRRNDVDCIVNLNVLRMLTLQKKSMIDGHQQACDFINRVVEQNQMATCGIYYPNTFNLAFSAAQTEAVGETCLARSTKSELVEEILKLQSADGGWDNDHNIWNDRVQSTAFAMLALFRFADLNEVRVQGSLRFATIYLIRELKRSPEGSYFWPGEVLFTATAIARSLVVWKSHSFTTALGAQALLKMQRHFPDYKISFSDYNRALAIRR